MAFLKLALSLTCVLLWKSAMTTDGKLYVHQESGFISANVGQNVTLRCFLQEDVAVTMFYWYKQKLGQKLRLISTFNKYHKSGTFSEEYKNDTRLSLEANKSIYHLIISDLQTSDSATYYCTSCYLYNLEFGKGTTVRVKGSGLNLPALVHPSVSSIIQPAGFVTLNCTVHTKTCDGERSVYWFSNSHPGIVYSVGGRNDQCERKPETQRPSCIYNLPESLNVSHAGTYLCAVASCRHMLFGNGTKLTSKEKVNSLPLVHFLSGALALTIILSVVLTFSVYKIKKANSCKCTDFRTRFSAPSTVNVQGDQDEDSLHYAALRGHRFNRATRQRDDTLSDCVYSTLKP